MDVLQVLGPDVRPIRERKPPWFKVPLPSGPRYQALAQLIKDENLHTVCQEAACPNVGECWDRGTATFMILGDTCTRRCGFCNVTTGKPTWNDPLEPARVARTIARMGLRHAVITSVDRDDLPDYGAGIWAATIRQVRAQAPDCQVEVLTPDFRGQEMPLARVHRRAARRLQPQPRGRAAALPAGPPRLALGALAARAAQRQGARRGRSRHEVRPDGRARRDARGDGRRVRGPARGRRPGADRRPVPAPDRPTTCRSSATGTRTSSRSSRRRPTRSASTTSPRGRSCARATTPISTSRRRGPASGRSAQPPPADDAGRGAPPRAGQHRAPAGTAGERAVGRVRRATRTGQRTSRRRAGLRLAPAGRERGRDLVPRLVDDATIVNLSVWESIEALRAFVYTDPEHLAVLRRRREWFGSMEAYLALWWIPAGNDPDGAGRRGAPAPAPGRGPGPARVHVPRAVRPAGPRAGGALTAAAAALQADDRSSLPAPRDPAGRRPLARRVRRASRWRPHCSRLAAAIAALIDGDGVLDVAADRAVRGVDLGLRAQRRGHRRQPADARDGR